MTTAASIPLRIAPGVVTTETAPTVLGIRPLEGVANVWEALVDDHHGNEPRVILTQGPKVISFIERKCVHTQARWAGKPFRLFPWQKGILVELFEVVWDAERERHARRYHEALIGTPKKNGKSDWLAAVGLYLLTEDGEPSPVIAAAAANEISANLVFNPIRTMVERSDGATESHALELTCDAFDKQIFLRGVPNAEIRRVPASPQSVEGLNLHANLMDEWHEWTNAGAEATATKLMNGTVLRPDYLNLRTSTAGHDLASLCGRDYEFGKLVATGEVEAPEWFFRWYEAPEFVDRDGRLEPLDWRSEEAVRLANPSYGLLSKWDYYQKKQRREPESSYRRYFLNQWTETETAWLPLGAWEACEVRGIELVPGHPTACGWDASTRNDSTAFVVVQRQGERFVFKAWIWERPIDPQTRRPLEGWLVPIDEVREVIRDVVARLKPSSIEYDQTFVTWEGAALKAIGYPMREFSQSSLMKLCAASQLLFELVINGLAAHSGEPDFRRHIRSAVARQVSSGSAAWQLTKGKARRKMDAAVAAAMAAWGLQHPPEIPDTGPPLLVFAGEDGVDEL